MAILEQAGLVYRNSQAMFSNFSKATPKEATFGLVVYERIDNQQSGRHLGRSSI